MTSSVRSHCSSRKDLHRVGVLGLWFLGVDSLHATVAGSERQPLDVTKPSRASQERLKGKLTEHFSSCVQFYEQSQLLNLARIERYLKHWLSWAKGAGIALPDSPLFGRGNCQTAPENRQ